MRKRTYLVWLLAICLALALQITALAGEETELNFSETIEISEDAPALFSDSREIAWQSTSNSYYDQLTGKAEAYYEIIAAAFLDDAEGEAPIPFKPLAEGEASCWALGTIVEETLVGTGNDYGDRFEEWLNEHAAHVSQAANAFVMDHPEYFWIRSAISLDYGYTGQASSTGYTINCFIKLGFVPLEKCNTTSTREALQKQIQDTVDELLARTEGLSPEQKVAYWDNWLANQNDYNEAAAQNSLKDSAYVTDVDSTPWSVVGGLLPGYEPVCEGYAKALQLLCHEAGIPCVQVSGLANGGGHMWAAVKLDDNWYFCDPTWDDPTYTENGEDMDYSTRYHLLTTQPDSHAVTDEYSLGTPGIHTTPYFVQNDSESVVSSEWLMDEQTGVCGLEIGSDTVVIALYGEGGKFLAIGTCDAIRWSASEYIYLAPAFDKDVLEQAVTARRFNITDVQTWIPVSAALPIE